MIYTNISNQLVTQKPTHTKKGVKTQKKQAITWADFDKAISKFSETTGFKEVGFVFQDEETGEFVENSRHKVELGETQYLATKVAKQYEDGNISVRTAVCVLKWVKENPRSKAKLTPVIVSRWNGEALDEEVITPQVKKVEVE